MKLLRHLGWRPGQGVGPRVSRHEKLSDKKEKHRMLVSQGAAVKGSGKPFKCLLDEYCAYAVTHFSSLLPCANLLDLICLGKYDKKNFRCEVTKEV